VSAAMAGAAVGSLLGGPIADVWGRRASIMATGCVGCLLPAVVALLPMCSDPCARPPPPRLPTLPCRYLFLAGSALMAMSTHMWMLLVGRALLGLAIGWSGFCVAVYVVVVWLGREV
jgi:MFS family permease